MTTLARLEELAQLSLAIALFARLPFKWWVYPALFFVPDLSLLGLLLGPQAGAITYNLVHHKALGLVAYILGSLLGKPKLALVGVVLLGHACFDRALGFELMPL